MSLTTNTYTCIHKSHPMNTHCTTSRKFPAMKYLLVTASALALVATGQAAESVSVASGTWSDANIWSPAVAPVASGTVHIEGGYTVNFTSGNSGQLTRVYVGDSFGALPTGNNGTLTVSGGTMTSNSNAAGAYVVGRAANSIGTFNVTGGTVIGIGSTGGTGMQLGFGENSQGNLNISAGELRMNGAIGAGLGLGSTGSITVSGGTLIVGSGTGTASTGITLGSGTSASGNMLVSGGTVAIGTGTAGSQNLWVGGRSTNATTSGTFTQTAGTVTVGGTLPVDSADYMLVGYSSSSNQNIQGTALLSGGSFTGNVRVGRASSVLTGGGTGTLIIGAAANVAGKTEAWEVSGTGEIIFQLGTTEAFNAVDLTAATTLALLFSQDGAKITIDGTNLLYAESFDPITLMLFDSGKGPSELSKSNVDFFYENFAPGLFAELVWTDTSLQLNVVPEPSTTAMILGAAALGWVVTRRRRQTRG